MDDFVEMIHPATGGRGSAHHEAFEEFWSKNGWELAPAVDPTDEPGVLEAGVGELAEADEVNTRPDSEEE